MESKGPLRVVMPRRALGVGVLLLATVNLPAGATVKIPYEWLQKLDDAEYARDRNQVEDDIDALPPSDVVDVVLALNECATPSDVARFEVFGSVVYQGKSVSTLALSGVRVVDTPALGADPQVAFVFLERPTQEDQFDPAALRSPRLPDARSVGVELVGHVGFAGHADTPGPHVEVERPGRRLNQKTRLLDPPVMPRDAEFDLAGAVDGHPQRSGSRRRLRARGDQPVGGPVGAGRAVQYAGQVTAGPDRGSGLTAAAAVP